MKKIKYAMVGGGEGSFIGPIHRMAAKMDDSAELVAGAFSRDRRNNAATAAKLSLDPSRVYDDWRALIAAEKGRIDFLTVCTPNDSHYAIAKAALEAGMHVMCEKPLSLTVREAKARLSGPSTAWRRRWTIPPNWSRGRFTGIAATTRRPPRSSRSILRGFTTIGGR
jgi:predicted dehydrogenase